MSKQQQDLECGSSATTTSEQFGHGKNIMAANAPSVPAIHHHEWVRGDPGAFGLICFGMTTTMLMFMDMDWSEKTFLPTVIAYAFAFGGGGQFVAGVLDLIKGNTFGGTVFASYGCFWIGWGIIELSKVYDPALFATAQTGKTLWFGLWALLTFLFFIISLRKNHGTMTILGLLTICFVLLAGGVHDAQCKLAAGYVGWACASAAIYTAFGMLVKLELGYVIPGLAQVHYI